MSDKIKAHVRSRNPRTPQANTRPRLVLPSFTPPERTKLAVAPERETEDFRALLPASSAPAPRGDISLAAPPYAVSASLTHR